MTHLQNVEIKAKIKVWFLKLTKYGKADQGNKSRQSKYLSNPHIILQDKGKVLTICKKNNFFLREKKNMVWRDYFDNEYLENFPLIYVGGC